MLKFLDKIERRNDISPCHNEKFTRSQVYKMTNKVNSSSRGKKKL